MVPLLIILLMFVVLTMYFHTGPNCLDVWMLSKVFYLSELL
jgi:hypothetical protein